MAVGSAEKLLAKSGLLASMPLKDLANFCAGTTSGSSGASVGASVGAEEGAEVVVAGDFEGDGVPGFLVEDEGAWVAVFFFFTVTDIFIVAVFAFFPFL